MSSIEMTLNENSRNGLRCVFSRMRSPTGDLCRPSPCVLAPFHSRRGRTIAAAEAASRRVRKRRRVCTIWAAAAWWNSDRHLWNLQTATRSNIICQAFSFFFWCSIKNRSTETI